MKGLSHGTYGSCGCLRFPAVTYAYEAVYSNMSTLLPLASCTAFSASYLRQLCYCSYRIIYSKKYIPIYLLRLRRIPNQVMSTHAQYSSNVRRISRRKKGSSVKAGFIEHKKTTQTSVNELVGFNPISCITTIIF